MSSRNYVCVLVFVCSLAIPASSKGLPTADSPGRVNVRIDPKRLRVYESSVRITLRYSRVQRATYEYNSTRVICIKILDQNHHEVSALNTSVNASTNSHTLEVPCETFARSGQYILKYFVEGITISFQQLKRKISVRDRRSGREAVRLSVPNNHTTAEPISVRIIKKHTKCKPYQDKLQLYWIHPWNHKHVLVATKMVKETKASKRTLVKFGCNTFDTPGLFYFKYISKDTGRTLARSRNISIFWGKYELIPESFKSIFPCSTSFAVKFTSPHCERTAGYEDKVEVRLKTNNKVIAYQTAYPGFMSVFFTSTTFERDIPQVYCFYYITKSSLTQTETIQTTICLPSHPVPGSQFSGWSAWSNWGLCSSPKDCGRGTKYRTRTCEPRVVFDETKTCVGSVLEYTSCTLPPCQGRRCDCSCVFTTPGGTIISPEWLPTFVPRSKSMCHWWINVKPNRTVKLWFDKLNLANHSIVEILDGNTSDSYILHRINGEQRQSINGDIFGSSNTVLVRYYMGGNFSKTNFGFQLSYSSIDTKSLQPPSAGKKQGVKMSFVGAVVVIILVMVAIFVGVLCKIRRKRRNPAQSQTPKIGKRTASSHTSTVCMSDTTFKSLYEPPISGDEGVNNNSSYPRSATNNHRPRVSGPIRINNRACVHICPRCCDHFEGCSFEFYDVTCQTRLQEPQRGAAMHDLTKEQRRNVCRMTRADENEQRHLDYL